MAANAQRSDTSPPLFALNIGLSGKALHPAGLSQALSLPRLAGSEQAFPLARRAGSPEHLTSTVEPHKVWRHVGSNELTETPAP